MLVVVLVLTAGGATAATAPGSGPGVEDRPVRAPGVDDRPVPAPVVAVPPVPGAPIRAFERPDGPYGRGHRGVDLRAVGGDRVHAAAAGTVAFAGRVAGTPWITLRHDGGLETTYGGAAPTVSAGDRVDPGATIGRMRDGRLHLDWGARLDGAYIDPWGLVAGWRVVLVPVLDAP
jgi:murein DD-endopeptidase MepM/ murein hydrolase activator NlpD